MFSRVSEKEFIKTLPPVTALAGYHQHDWWNLRSQFNNSFFETPYCGDAEFNWAISLNAKSVRAYRTILYMMAGNEFIKLGSRLVLGKRHNVPSALYFPDQEEVEELGLPEKCLHYPAAVSLPCIGSYYGEPVCLSYDYFSEPKGRPELTSSSSSTLIRELAYSSYAKEVAELAREKLDQAKEFERQRGQALRPGELLFFNKPWLACTGEVLTRHLKNEKGRLPQASLPFVTANSIPSALAV